MRQNNHVIKLAAARDAMLPCIITTDADTCEGAQTRQRHMDLLRIDEANFIDLSLERRRPSLFNKSRSCRRSSFSLRSRASSWLMSSCGPESKSFSAKLRRQRSSVDLPMLRSSATDEMLRPLVVKIRTASRLNSSVNSRCFNSKSPVSLV